MYTGKKSPDIFQNSNIGSVMHAEDDRPGNVNTDGESFGAGGVDNAWDRLESFQQESRGVIYDAARWPWESRMNYLAARILLKTE